MMEIATEEPKVGDIVYKVHPITGKKTKGRIINTNSSVIVNYGKDEEGKPRQVKMTDLITTTKELIPPEEFIKQPLDHKGPFYVRDKK